MDNSARLGTERRLLVIKQAIKALDVLTRDVTTRDFNDTAAWDLIDSLKTARNAADEKLAQS